MLFFELIFEFERHVHDIGFMFTSLKVVNIAVFIFYSHQSSGFTVFLKGRHSVSSLSFREPETEMELSQILVSGFGRQNSEQGQILQGSAISLVILPSFSGSVTSLAEIPFSESILEAAAEDCHDL